MIIQLYISSADKERVDKTSYLAFLSTLEGSLRDPCSVENPTIQVQLLKAQAVAVVDGDGERLEDADNQEVGTNPRITEANYMYIAEFERFYFITDIQCNHTGLYIVSGRVDPLMSFKDYIGELECFVSRNEFAYSVALEDNLLPLEFLKLQDETVPTSGTLVNTVFNSGTVVNQTNIVMGIATDNYAGSIPDTTYNGFGSGLPQIEPESFSSYRSSMFYAMSKDMFGMISNALLSDDAKASFVKSIVVLPFDPKSSFSENKNIFFGLKNDLDNLMLLENGHNASGYPVQAFSGYRVIADFVFPSPSSYLDIPPFTHYEMFIPFYGFVEVNAQFMFGYRIIVYYAINYEDGSATAFIYNYTLRKMMWSSPCQVGVLLNLSTTNAKENTTQKNANALNLAVGIIGSAVSLGAGVASGNPLMSAGAVLGATKSITGFFNSNAMLFDRAQTSNSGSASGLFNYLKVRIRKTSQFSTLSGSEMAKFAHSAGRPLREYRKLSALRGFTVAQSVHLDGVPCLSGEAESIISALASGVIL